MEGRISNPSQTVFFKSTEASGNVKFTFQDALIPFFLDDLMMIQWLSQYPINQYFSTASAAFEH